MRAFILALLICVTSGPLRAQDDPRAVRPAFKGVELYSWKECSSCVWQFALLPGTNRTKTVTEIKDRTRTIFGVSELRQHLLRLPREENVFWNSRSPAGFSLPETDTIAELVAFAAKHNVTLKVGQPTAGAGA